MRNTFALVSWRPLALGLAVLAAAGCEGQHAFAPLLEQSESAWDVAERISELENSRCGTARFEGARLRLNLPPYDEWQTVHHCIWEADVARLTGHREPPWLSYCHNPRPPTGFTSLEAWNEEIRGLEREWKAKHGPTPLES